MGDKAPSLPNVNSNFNPSDTGFDRAVYDFENNKSRRRNMKNRIYSGGT
jgi:hypothetical protein